MKELVTDIITRECDNILPGIGKLREVVIKADTRFGFHVIVSQRFICTLRPFGQYHEPLGIKVFVKNRPNVEQEYKNMQQFPEDHAPQ